MWIKIIIATVVLFGTFRYGSNEDVGTLLQNKNMLEIFAEQARQYPDVMQSQLTRLLGKENKNVADGVIGLLQNPEIEQSNVIPCAICTVLFTAVIPLVQNKTWEDFEPEAVDVCKIIMMLGGSNEQAADTQCVGMMALQGPHVLHLLQSLNVVRPPPTPATLCEHVNLCFVVDDLKPSFPRNKKFPSLEDPENLLPMKPEVQQKETVGRHDINMGMRRREMLGRFLKKTRRSVTDEDTLTIIQLTDMHIDHSYAEGSATDCGLYSCCREDYEGSGEAGPWGDYACNTPQRTTDLFLNKIAEIDPDFIIYSGDTAPHHFWDETYSSQLNCTWLLIDSLTRTLGGYKIYPNIGNHEMYPTNMYGLGLPVSKNMSEVFAEWWTPLAGFGSDQIETMSKAGYYAMEVMPGLRILSFNTNFWYVYNWHNTLNSLEDELEEMFVFMEDTLKNASEKGDKVIVVGHHPVGNSDNIVTYTHRYTNMMMTYQDTIVLHVTGHTHKDEFRVATDAEGEAVGVVLVSPCATPKTNRNPTMRRYNLNSTFKLLNYESYMFDLEAAMKTETEPKIEFVYDPITEYGMADLSSAEWLKLVDRMESDDELFQKYYYNHFARGIENPGCDSSCKRDFLCKLRNTNYHQYRQCRSDDETGTSDPPTDSTPETTAAPTAAPTTTPDSGNMPTVFLPLIGLAMMILHFV